MQSKLWKMILIVALPLMIVIFLIATIGIGYVLQYNAILNNVTTASNFNVISSSDFNQSWADDIDSKMYH